MQEERKHLNDKLVIENVVSSLEALVNLEPQGKVLVEQLQHKGETAMASTSSQGQENIRNEMAGLRESFENVFKGLFFIDDIKLYLLEVKM